MSLLVGMQSDYYDYQLDGSESNPMYLRGDEIVSDSEVCLFFDMTTIFTNTKNLQKEVFLKPVYIKMINGIEQLVYDSKIMEYEKKYRVTWNDEEFIIIKKEHNIDLYKFYPEK